MTLVDKIFTIQNTVPFNTLRHSEIILTANISSVKKFSKGSPLTSTDVAIQNLYVIIQGEVSYDGKKISNFFGAEELLNDIVLDKEIICESDVEVLLISKGHFFTLIYECPGLMIELLAHFQNNRIES